MGPPGIWLITALCLCITTVALAQVYDPSTGQQKVITTNSGTGARGSGSATDTSATTILAASGSASLKSYVTGVQCFRTDAGTATAYVTLNDSASSVVALPVGGGSNNVFATPLVTAANTVLTFTASTSLNAVKCNAQGYYAQ